ncbi:MAG: hypothetical protein ABSD20_01335, partial [Terriglobales bacterium]
MKKLTFLVLLCALFALSKSSQAQQFDFGVGASTVLAPSTSYGNSSGNYTQTVGTGTYINFGGDFLFWHHVGIDIDGAVRANESYYNQSLYGYGAPFRPVFYDFNAIWAPPLGRKLSAELVAGVGVQDIRAYGYYNCNGFVGCTNYTSVNNFQADFGAGLRYYFHGNAFIRPEVRFYVVPNQNNASNFFA